MILLIFTFLIASSESYRILCLLPYPGKSHYMVFEPLLQELTNRGHHLTVVSFFPSNLSRANRRDVSLVNLAPLNVEVVDLQDIEHTYLGLEKYFDHIPLVTALAKSSVRLCEKIINSNVFEEFVRGEGEYDLIMVEHFNSDCMLGIVHKYRLPSVGLMSCAMMPWTPTRVGAPDNPAYVPGMTLPFTEEMTFLERTINTLVLYFYNTWFEYVIWQEEQNILEKKLGHKLPRLSEVGKNTSIVLVNTHYSWNGVRVVPPSIVEVGGIHLHNRTVQPLPEPLEKWVSGTEDGFILISFGSLIRGSSLPPKRLEVMLRAFARLQQRIVWKWEADVAENLPKNVRMMKWIPQYDLLKHPNCVAFITHGGLLSLTEAVAAGVPTLVLPVLGDQFGNAAHAQRAGVAEVLRLNDIQEHVLYHALTRVLSDEKRTRAKALSEAWRDRPQSPMQVAVFHIERAARRGWGAGGQMSAHARRLGTIQLALLDLAGLVVMVVGLVFFVVKYACKTKRKEKLN